MISIAFLNSEWHHFFFQNSIAQTGADSFTPLKKNLKNK